MARTRDGGPLTGQQRWPVSGTHDRAVRTWCRSRRIIDRQGDLSTEAAVAELFEDGEVQRHIGRIRRIDARRRQALLESLERHLPGAFSIELPRGDMALWGQGIAGDDTDAWAARGLEHGVDVSPASRYWFGRGRVDGFRLGFVDSHCSAVPCARSVML